MAQPSEETKIRWRSLLRFDSIMYNMEELLDEAYKIVQDQGSDADVKRADSSWYADILGALDKENSGFPGGSTVGMMETLKDLRDRKKK